MADDDGDPVLDREQVARWGNEHPEWFAVSPGAADDDADADAAADSTRHSPRPWVRATLLGRGESYEAWTLTRTHLPDAGPSRHDAVVLRTPYRGAQDLPRPMGEEFAALHLAPAGLGPRPIHLQDEPREGTPPFMVTSWVRGQIRGAAGWDDATLAAHGRALARLHARTWPTPGAVTTADTNPPAPCSPRQHLDDGLDWWREHHPLALDHPAVRALVPRVRDAVARVDADADRVSSYSLLHGDAVAGNILLTSAGPSYIDWEWASIGDRARDLGLLGGAVHADPWYLPLSTVSIAHLVRAYLDAGGAEHEPDAAALTRRRDAWLLSEALGNTAYLAWTIEDPQQPASARRERTFAQLIRSLDEALAGRAHAPRW